MRAKPYARSGKKFPSVLVSRQPVYDRGMKVHRARKSTRRGHGKVRFL